MHRVLPQYPFRFSLASFLAWDSPELQDRADSVCELCLRDTPQRVLHRYRLGHHAVAGRGTSLGKVYVYILSYRVY
jgi:hypothetical protein